MSRKKWAASICGCHMDHVFGEDLPDNKVCECHECSEELRILHAQFLKYEMKLSPEEIENRMSRIKWTT